MVGPPSNEIDQRASIDMEPYSQLVGSFRIAVGSLGFGSPWLMARVAETAQGVESDLAGGGTWTSCWLDP